MNEIASATWAGGWSHDDQAVCAEVKGTADAQPLTRRRPDDLGGPGRAHGVEVRQEVGLGHGAVLEVDDQPVEAGTGQDLGRDRRSEGRERAVQRLAGLEAAAQVEEAGNGREARGLCRHGGMMRRATTAR